MTKKYRQENIKNKDLTILFIPELGIYPFARGLAVLGDAIIKTNGQVMITQCTGQMSRCPMMAMEQLSVNASPKEKASLCEICLKRFAQVQKKYKFESVNLSEFVGDKLLNDIDDLIKDNLSNLEDTKFDECEIGKIAQYDFSLETKFPYSSQLTEEQKKLFSLYLKNTALSIAIANAIFEKHNPQLVLTFNDYAQGQAVRYSANKHNVTRMALTYPVHYNIDFSRFSLWKSTMYITFLYKHCQQWLTVKNTPIQGAHVMECWKDAIFRMYSSGSHIFSPANDINPNIIFNKLNLDPKRKTIIVYTSSKDEMNGIEIMMNVWNEKSNIENVFPNQIEWLSWLNTYASKRNDIQIVVRIHPREGKRQLGCKSKHLEQLEANFFNKTTSSFIIIWPDDPISSYDLMELADLCLVPWTTIGQEAARVGIPVLSMTRNMYYPDDDFIQVATSVEEYAKKLNAILNMDYTWKHLLKAVRFYHWRTFIPSLDLRETVPTNYDNKNIWPEVPEKMTQVVADILRGKEDLLEYNIRQWHASLSTDAHIAETQAMQKGIRIFLDKIFYPGTQKETIIFRIVRRLWRKLTGNNITLPQKAFVDYSLKYSDNISKMQEFVEQTKKNKHLRILVSDGIYATLIHRAKVHRRMSHMVIKLARLHDSENCHYQKNAK